MATIPDLENMATGPMTARELRSIQTLIDRANNVPHASMYFEEESETLTMVQNTWVPITNATNDLFTGDGSGITVTDDTIVIVTAGDYMLQASLSFSGTTNADLYQFAAFKEDVLASPKIERTTTSTDVGNVSLSFYISGCVPGEIIDLRIRNIANDFDATLVACSWVTWILHY